MAARAKKKTHKRKLGSSVVEQKPPMLVIGVRFPSVPGLGPRGSGGLVDRALDL